MTLSPAGPQMQLPSEYWWRFKCEQQTMPKREIIGVESQPPVFTEEQFLLAHLSGLDMEADSHREIYAWLVKHSLPAWPATFIYQWRQWRAEQKSHSV